MIPIALAELLVDTLLTYFCPRHDYFKIAYSSKNQHQPCHTTDPRGLLLAHLAGSQAPDTQVTLTEGSEGFPKSRWRVGVYPFGTDGLCRWVCIDCDGGSHHSAALKDPLSTALQVYQKAITLGLPAYLEQSGSGEGWHIWIFFEVGIQPELARTIGMGLCPPDAPLKDNPEKMASVLLGQGLEVFPKAWQASPKGGQPIWLPWYSEAQYGANLFYEVGGLDVIVTHPQPTSFIRATYDHLLTAAKSLPSTAYWKGPTADSKPKVNSLKTKHKLDIENVLGDVQPSYPSLPGELEQTPGLEWREKIILSAPLEVVYAPFLTGKQKGSSWLECKDYRSGSGDTHPSAGVSTGEDPSYPRGLWHSFIDGKSLSIFDYLIETTASGVLGQVYPDFKAAALYLAQLTNIPYPKRGANASGKDPTERLPLIFTTQQQMITIIGEARNAIHKANHPPALFCRANELVTIQDDTIRTVTTNRINGVLYRVAQWHAHSGDKVVVSKPPMEVGADLLTYIDERMPPLDRVIGSPIYSPSGVLCDEYGYHPEARAYITYQGYINAPTHPKQWEAAASAQWLLSQLFGDFPFATQSDRAHALGALLTPLVRDLIKGPTPPHDVGSPVAGSGKDLFVQSIATVYLGQQVTGQGLPIQEEEIAKTIIAELSLGRPIVLFNNVDTKDRTVIDSGSLEALFTSEHWTGRVLQTSKMSPEYPNRAIWFMTGVNLRFASGLIRRRIRIRLDPRTDEPWKRPASTFRHPGNQLLLWVKENRDKILSHLITMSRYYLALPKEKRPTVRSHGSFESWSDLVGGILAVAGVDGWLTFQDDPDDAVSEEGTADWLEFIMEWEKERITEKTVTELNALCNVKDLMLAVRGDMSKSSQQIRLGISLKQMRGRVFDGKIITCHHNKTTKKTLYDLVPAKGKPTLPPTLPSREPGEDDDSPF